MVSAPRSLHGFERRVAVEDLKRHADDPVASVEHLAIGNGVEMTAQSFSCEQEYALRRFERNTPDE